MQGHYHTKHCSHLFFFYETNWWHGGKIYIISSVATNINLGGPGGRKVCKNQSIEYVDQPLQFLLFMLRSH